MSVEASGLRIRRGERILFDGLTLAVPDGCIHAIVGGNGTGKSSLLAALAGDLAPDAGEIRLDAIPLPQLSDRDQAQRRAVLTQHHPALPYAPRDLIELASPALDRPHVDALLRDFALEAFGDRRMTTLSGGERGRARLAMTIAQGTRTLLLDEPTAAFDREFRVRFVEWLREWRDQGKAIIVVTHDADVESVADAVTALS